MSFAKGPDNVVLSSKYTNRDSAAYLRSLGQLIVDFGKVVPHGLLVFFPSYRALEVTTDFWKVNKLNSKLINYLSAIKWLSINLKEKQPMEANRRREEHIRGEQGS